LRATFPLKRNGKAAAKAGEPEDLPGTDALVLCGHTNSRGIYKLGYKLGKALQAFLLGGLFYLEVPPAESLPTIFGKKTKGVYACIYTGVSSRI
jgi:hypothetical protein